MGHEERFGRNGREAAQAAAEAWHARVQGLPWKPEGEPAGLAPSEFLVAIAAQRIGACNAAAAGIRQFLTQPNLTISGKPRVDPVATLLMNVALVLDSQAALMDLMLSYLAGRAELRPVQPPEPEEPTA